METAQICIYIYVKTIDTHTNIHVNPCQKYGNNIIMYINLCKRTHMCINAKHMESTRIFI